MAGHDVVLRLTVSVQQLFAGGEVRIAVRRPVTCPSCQGEGDLGCVCHGVGRIEIREVGQDGTAPTMLVRDAAALERVPVLDDSQAGTAYVARAGDQIAAELERRWPAPPSW